MLWRNASNIVSHTFRSIQSFSRISLLRLLALSSHNCRLSTMSPIGNSRQHSHGSQIYSRSSSCPGTGRLSGPKPCRCWSILHPTAPRANPMMNRAANESTNQSKYASGSHPHVRTSTDQDESAVPMPNDESRPQRKGSGWFFHQWCPRSAGVQTFAKAEMAFMAAKNPNGKQKVMYNTQSGARPAFLSRHAPMMQRRKQ